MHENNQALVDCCRGGCQKDRGRIQKFVSGALHQKHGHPPSLPSVPYQQSSRSDRRLHYHRTRCTSTGFVILAHQHSVEPCTLVERSLSWYPCCLLSPSLFICSSSQKDGVLLAGAHHFQPRQERGGQSNNQQLAIITLLSHPPHNRTSSPTTTPTPHCTERHTHSFTHSSAVTQWLALWSAVAAHVRSFEPSCLSYELYHDEHDADSVMIFERYVTEVDLTITHRQSAPFLTLRQRSQEGQLVKESRSRGYNESAIGFVCRNEAAAATH